MLLGGNKRKGEERRGGFRVGKGEKEISKTGE